MIRCLGVSLIERQRLRTLGDSNPITFWLYQPQHDPDQALVNPFSCPGDDE